MNVWAFPENILSIRLFLFVLGSVPALGSFPSGSTASYGIVFFPKHFSNGHWAWSAAFLSCTAAQCSPPCQEAILPTASGSGSRFDFFCSPLISSWFYLMQNDNYSCPFPGFLPHQPFQPQPMSMGGPSSFPPPGPSMPAAGLSGPPLPPSSSAPGGLPPMPSPGVPPTAFMPSTSLSSHFMPTSSQPGAPVPMYQGGPHNQGPVSPMIPAPYAPLGSGYPQGGPGAPAVKPFPAPTVAPPPTGTCWSRSSQELNYLFSILFFFHRCLSKYF